MTSPDPVWYVPAPHTVYGAHTRSCVAVGASSACATDSDTVVGASATTTSTSGAVVSVGTTALRLLETVARDHDGAVPAWAGETDIFIVPGFRFRAVDLLLTNFHLPRSTLFMLVSAFAGLERMKEAYAHAVRERYRFYSYGDCCLLRR